MIGGEDIEMGGVDGLVMERADDGGVVVHVLDGDVELLVMAGGMVGIEGIWWVDDGGQLLVVCAEQKDGGWVWCQGCKVGPLSGRVEGRW